MCTTCSGLTCTPSWILAHSKQSAWINSGGSGHVSDFARIRLKDLDMDATCEFALADLN
jgi:hypothetical protein